MFGTSIHWTTFFYLLIDIFILLFAFIQSLKKKQNDLNRYLYLGLLYVLYNFTGGFLPSPTLSGPIIIQYIITYGVAIALCVYIVYYLYKEYDITILDYYSTPKNFFFIANGTFLLFFLGPYVFTSSLSISRISFAIPISFVAFFFLVIFYKKISNPVNPNSFVIRRNKLSLVAVTCMALLPICTVIGDYQWLTFSIMNLGFFAVTAIEIDRYLYLLENKNKMFEVFAFYKANQQKLAKSKFIYQSLTRREIEIALAILNKMTYKDISINYFISDKTVSKHASNIFKKTDVKNKTEFLNKFAAKKS